MRTISVILLALFMTACVSKYKTDAFNAPIRPISASGSAYVMLARDGFYGSRTYPGSGRTVSQQLYNVISLRMGKVNVATRVESRDDAIETARARGFTYVFAPTILNCEDRATAWSGRPDRITIQIGVWDVATGTEVASATQRASSKWGTLGGDHPQDLVPRLVQIFANRLFQ